MKPRFIKSPMISRYIKGQNKGKHITPGFIYSLDKHVQQLIDHALIISGDRSVMDINAAEAAGIFLTGYRP